MMTTLPPAEIHSVESAPAVGNTQLPVLLAGAGIASLDDIGWLRVTGEDRVRWLNGMVTNSIQQLAPGEGCYNFVLNAQGRILGDLTAFVLPGSILLQTGREQLPALIAHFERFIIMDDVELAVVNEDRAGVLLAGPQAAPVLQKLGLALAHTSSLSLQSTVWSRSPIDVVCAHSSLVPRFELWSDLTTTLEIQEALIAAGVASVSPAAIEALRILEGTPRYGIDIRNTDKAHDLPQETGQSRALHFTKGCYLGQEIVERIRSRGNVHRTFTGFTLDGTLPIAGATLTSQGKPAGEITSVASVPLAASATSAGKTLQIALGYVRREALAADRALDYPGGAATPVALPFTFS